MYMDCLFLSKPIHQQFKLGHFSHLDTVHVPYLLICVGDLRTANSSHSPANLNFLNSRFKF